MSRLKVGPSEIHGSGTFAACDIPSGAIITHAEMVGVMIGFNHSCDANTSRVLFTSTKEPYRTVSRDIKAGEELVVDYGVHGASPRDCLCPRCR